MIIPTDFCPGLFARHCETRSAVAIQGSCEQGSCEQGPCEQGPCERGSVLAAHGLPRRKGGSQ